jgi:hypothetical protein
MAGTPRLDETLVQVFSQPQHWGDLRHLKTLAGMMGGLIPSGQSRLMAWAPSVYSRAVYAQSRVRRLARWLAKARIAVHARSGPRLPHTLAEWGDHIVSLALETSL